MVILHHNNIFASFDYNSISPTKSPTSYDPTQSPTKEPTLAPTSAPIIGNEIIDNSVFIYFYNKNKNFIF